MRPSRFNLDSRVQNTMITCALRFDGYRWLEATQGRDPHDFRPWTVPLVQSLRLHPTDAESFATYFALQRWLFKWGGEMQSQSAAGHTAFRFLFLHLHHLPTPPDFVNPEYERQWLGIDRGTIAEHAAAVRVALLDRVLARNVAKERDET
ncbi:MAG: hypothetical protein IT577_15175 [Verrucomicrobiae bacterium]|nr:hypothetical protein [Verrucomicrobiae bacterium]